MDIQNHNKQNISYIQLDIKYMKHLSILTHFNKPGTIVRIHTRNVKTEVKGTPRTIHLNKLKLTHIQNRPPERFHETT